MRPGVVIVQVPPADRTGIWAKDTREQFAILSAATDARGRRLQVIRVDGPETLRSGNPGFLDSYLNLHVANGAVVLARFGTGTRPRGPRGRRPPRSPAAARSRSTWAA
ncbi:agmatine deiminase family protein [Streptomyces sp. NPDC058646]|uniref:agmatine deiminase family protein n=1 Tax=Streptomyces sp. NPDC058646 TaxID=3346574 RepID=UPI00365CC3AE